MTDITTIVVVAVVVIVVAAIAVGAATMLRKRHSDRLREQFGPEYERTMRDTDDPRAAEKQLDQRRKRHRSLRLRDLDQREKDGYRQRWQVVQQGFVDDPGTAVREADRLVADVMADRGYPTEDFEQRAEDLSVDYPVVTQRYREARGISREHAAGNAGTEDLRHAVTSYRTLVEALLEDDAGHASGDGDGGWERGRHAPEPGAGPTAGGRAPAGPAAANGSVDGRTRELPPQQPPPQQPPPQQPPPQQPPPQQPPPQQAPPQQPPPQQPPPGRGAGPTHDARRETRT
ncbi:hypothetical protein ACLFMI_13070 [Pseudonocardia nantongensis]|uniref:hypothetical protein n=1 Tax=Pseudonocardia nantongensis TaxID=1181885 RepID=UPI003978F8E7